MAATETTWLTTTTCRITLGIAEPEGHSAIGGWWLTCRLEGESDAEGSVLFQSISTPNHYVFGIDSYGISPSGDDLDLPSDVLGPISDFSSEATGATLTSANTNIIQFTIGVSGATGSFSLVLDSDNSGWGCPETLDAENTFSAGANCLLASFALPVPEPSCALLLWTVATAGILAVGVRNYVKDRQRPRADRMQ